MPFSARPVADRTLGERLRHVREDAKKTIEEAGHATGIHPRYLTAIESGDYSGLPGRIYAKRYVSAYAGFLGVSESTAIAEFEREYPVAVKPTRPHPALPQAHQRAWVTAILGRRALVGLAILGILLYLGLEALRLLVPPSLTISSPPEPFTTTQLQVEVTGRTAAEATVTLNGDVVPVDARGFFREIVELAPGTSTLAITAKRPRGRSKTVLRHITVPQPPAPSTDGAPSP